MVWEIEGTNTKFFSRGPYTELYLLTLLNLQICWTYLKLEKETANWLHLPHCNIYP